MMKFACTFCLIACFLIAMPAAVLPVASAAGEMAAQTEEEKLPNKAMWLWNRDGALINKPDEVLNFSAENGFKLIYLHVLPEQYPQEALKDFIRKAHEKGIEVHALQGSPGHALAENRDTIAKFTDWIAAYNAKAAENERFAGIHWSIQPYALAEWAEDHGSVIRQWMNNVRYYTDYTRKLGLEISADIPFWLDRYEVTESGQTLSLSRWLMLQHDHVTVLANRNFAAGANGILDLIQEEIAWSKEDGTHFFVGVEFKPSGEGKHVSFYQKSAAQVSLELAAVHDRLKDLPTYKGIAVHEYDSYAHAKTGMDKAPADNGEGTEQPAAGEPTGMRKALWLWNGDAVVIKDPEKVLEICVQDGFKVIYLHINPDQYPKKYFRDFIRLAGEKGIEVHALHGSPHHALEEYRYQITEFTDWIAAYNAESAEEERFKGIHWDIEPHVTPEWWEDRDAVMKQWMANVSHYVDRTRKAGMEISADIPFWMAQYEVEADGKTLPLSRWMMQKHDDITLMTYRNFAEGPNGILDLVQEEIGWAKEDGTRFYIGVETKPSLEGPYVSFHDKGRKEMYKELQTVHYRMKDYDFYLGITIHQYNSYSSLKP